MSLCENCGQPKPANGGKHLTEEDWELASLVGLSVPCWVCAECLAEILEE